MMVLLFNQVNRLFMKTILIFIVAMTMFSCAINQNVSKVIICSKQELYYNKKVRDTRALWNRAYVYAYFDKNQSDSFRLTQKMKGYLCKDDYDHTVTIGLDSKVVINNTDTVSLFFFPNIIKEREKLKYFNERNTLYYQGKELKYWTKTRVLQAITIPMKIRFKHNDIPAQISTSFNAGIAYGYQFNKSYLRNEYYPNLTSQIENKVSYTIAGFGGLTPISLKPSNTDNKLNAEESILGIDYGLIFLVSINKINTGVCVSLDTPVQKDGRYWIYNTKPWLGVVLGIDFLR